MKTRSLVIMAMLTAILFLGQVCMAFLPNIEVVTLLVILYTQVYKKKVFLYYLRVCPAGRRSSTVRDLVVQLSVCVEHSGIDRTCS